MRNIFFVLFALVFITSCKKERERVSKIEDGVYTGTFHRSSPTSRFATANVEMTFNGNRFSGSSDISNYPAICNGTFKAGTSKMEVVNECMFTANFDWTYIFMGEYEYEVDGVEVRITKRYPNSTFTDRYVLKKVN